MKTILLLFFFVLVHLSASGQEYYILKHNDKVKNEKSDNSLITKLSDFKRKKKDAKKEGVILKKPKDLRGLNRLLFSDTNRVQTAQLAFGTGDINGQLYTNLVNDVFISKNKKYLGEISLGSVISNTTSSDSSQNKEASNINNFFNGGGNIFIKYAYLSPLGYTDGYDNFTFLNALTLRAASNLPKLSQNERLEAWNIEIADEFTISLNGNNNKLGLLLKPKVALVLGSEKFSESILRDSSRSFAYFQMQGAIKVSNSFLINLSFKPIISKSRSDYFQEKQFSTIGIQALI